MTVLDSYDTSDSIISDLVSCARGVGISFATGFFFMSAAPAIRNGFWQRAAT